MGVFMKEDDVFIGSLLEALNLRFCRYRLDDLAVVDGIDELKSLQDEFAIFKKGRSLVESLRILNVGGTWHPQVKKKWFDLLRWVEEVDSDTQSVKGGPAIVNALVRNFTTDNMLPVYFQAHDLTDPAKGERVIIKSRDRPLFYMVEDHVSISLPMKARTVSPTVPARSKPGGKPKKPSKGKKK